VVEALPDLKDVQQRAPAGTQVQVHGQTATPVIQGLNMIIT
jgi:hypothetical protein